MDKIKKFLAAHSITTHSVVAFCIAMVECYHNVPQFHDFVLFVWGKLPNEGRAGAEALIAAIAWYWKGRTQWTPEQRAQLTGENANTAAAGK